MSVGLAFMIGNAFKNVMQNEAVRRYNTKLEEQAKETEVAAEANQATNNQTAQQNFWTQLELSENPELINQYRQKFGQTIGQNTQSYLQSMNKAQDILAQKQPVTSSGEAFLGGAVEGLPFLML